MFNFTSRYPAVISIVLLGISFLISFYFYRKSSLPKSKKIFLVGLKSLAVFLVLVLFIEPSLLAIIKIKKTSSNIILIDNSRSNNLVSSDNSMKKDNIAKLLNERDFNSS